MQRIDIKSRNRRDLTILAECESESCKHQMEMQAYDDRNFWENVMPNKCCPDCGESTNSLGLSAEHHVLKYHPDQVV